MLSTSRIADAALAPSKSSWEGLLGGWALIIRDARWNIFGGILRLRVVG